MASFEREKKYHANTEILSKPLEPKELGRRNEEIHSTECHGKSRRQHEKQREPPPKDQMRERLAKRDAHRKSDRRPDPELLKNQVEYDRRREIFSNEAESVFDAEAL
jgi:hypothetical protein